MECCSNCKFHRMAEDGKEAYVSCHRFPPTGCAVDMGNGVMAITVYPEVEEYDWCGEWRSEVDVDVMEYIIKGVPEEPVLYKQETKWDPSRKANVTIGYYSDGTYDVTDLAGHVILDRGYHDGEEMA